MSIDQETNDFVNLLGNALTDLAGKPTKELEILNTETTIIKVLYIEAKDDIVVIKGVRMWVKPPDVLDKQPLVVPGPFHIPFLSAITNIKLTEDIYQKFIMERFFETYHVLKEERGDSDVH